MFDLTHSTPELFSALAGAQGELENASKNAANPHFRSKYADLAEVLNTVRPVLAKHGLSMMQTTGFDGSLVHVTTILGHSGGGYVTTTASCQPAKTDAQGVGSATTYLRRYSAAAVAGVAQEDDDGQSAAHSAKPLDPKQTAAVLEWTDAIKAVAEKPELDKLASELKAANLAPAQLREIRAAYASKAKELAA